MAAATKADAFNARQRDAMILPFKRKIASLAIRADNWKRAVKAAKDDGARNEAQTLAQGAIVEIDGQLADLQDIKFPAETKANTAQVEMDKMKASYADIRKALIAISSEPA